MEEIFKHTTKISSSLSTPAVTDNTVLIVAFVDMTCLVRISAPMAANNMGIENSEYLYDPNGIHYGLSTWNKQRFMKLTSQ